MPDALGCREQAQMPRTRADAARRRGCRAHARMPRALVSVEQAFLLQLQSSKSSLMMPKGPKDVQIFLGVRKPFCTKLLYTSCLMRADAAHGRGCRIRACGRGCRARCCLWNERFFSKIPYCNDAYRGSSVSLCEKLFCTKLLYFMPDARGSRARCFLWNRRFFCSYNLEG